MTKTWSKVALSASLSFLLLTGCSSSSSDTKAGASRADAGSAPDASQSDNPQPNEVEDAAVSAAADSGGSDRGETPAGGSGGTGGSTRPPRPQAGSVGGTGSDHGPPAAGSAAGTGSDADAGTEAPDPDPDPKAICTTCAACEQSIPIVSTMHTNMPVNYSDPPPTSGPHNPCWASWGIHDEPLAAERWVHNLEHGGVVFLYNCPEGCADAVATLKNIASARSRTVLAAYDKLPARFGVVSWGHRLVSECLDEQAFTTFYTAHFDRAPESNGNPPNPSCPP